MAEVCFITFDKESGKATAAVSGAPVDVADFLALWAQNTEEGMGLAQRLGVDLTFVAEDEDDE